MSFVDFYARAKHISSTEARALLSQRANNASLRKLEQQGRLGFSLAQSTGRNVRDDDNMDDVDEMDETEAVEEDEVVCGAGAKPFIEYTIQAVTEYGQGHEVIYPVPGFPVYENQVRHQGAVAVPFAVPARPDEKRELDELESRISLVCSM